MTTLTDSIEIKIRPEELFEGLIRVFSSEEYYRRWHRDHVRCLWVKGRPFEEGSILYVEEYLHGRLHKMKFLDIKVEPNRKVEYRLSFPTSVVCPKGSFTIEPKGESCTFTATLFFRFGRAFAKLARSRVEAMERHMKEEGENLKNLLEQN